MGLSRTVRVIVGVATICTAPFQILSAAPSHEHVFKTPKVNLQMQAAIGALQTKRFSAAQNILEQISATYPWYMEAHYILATLFAVQNKKEEALSYLQKAVDAGFDKKSLLFKDRNLATIRDDARFLKLAENLVQKSGVQKSSHINPIAVQGNLAPVGLENTVWDQRLSALRSFYKFNSRKVAAATVQNIKDPAAEKLNKLFQRGLAAGNTGDIYDNRDRRHSILNTKQYPQLAFSRYGSPAQAQNIDYGFNDKILLGGITFGNSSTAISSGPLWRSQGRLAYTSPNGPQKLALQYLSNHIYVYPAVNDFKGKNDHLPTNTPYMLLTEGKSGSDRPFLRAIATILAALKPSEKDKLVKNGKLMPAVQTIFRQGQKNITGMTGYLTAQAHPVVFNSKSINLVKMIELAQRFKADQFPAVAQLKVVKENSAISGIDDYAKTLPEQLFTSPAAIARVIRYSSHQKTMTVTAQSFNKNFENPITYKWVLLQGDPKKVTIKPLNKEATTVEISSKWHADIPVAGHPEMRSSRVDIAVFALHNGIASAPSFVTFKYPTHQKRTYNKNGKVVSIDHRSPKGTYIDPQLYPKRNWIDEYSYNEKGRLIGWTRTENGKSREYTYHGARILEKDRLNRPTKAQKVKYIYSRTQKGAMEVREELEDKILNYEYLSDKDTRGILLSQ